MTREDLEKIALFTVSSELYYSLADDIDITSDRQLIDLIKCNGDYEKEQELYNDTRHD